MPNLEYSMACAAVFGKQVTQRTKSPLKWRWGYLDAGARGVVHRCRDDSARSRGYSSLLPMGDQTP